MSLKDFTVRLHKAVDRTFTTEDKVVKGLDAAVKHVQATAHTAFHIYDDVGTLVKSGFGTKPVDEAKRAEEVAAVEAKIDAVAETATAVVEAADAKVDEVKPAVETAVETAETVAAVAEVVEAVKPTKKKSK